MQYMAQYRDGGLARLLQTGQTTVYVVGDDGTTQKGRPKSYSILTLGQYSGFTNIILNGKTDIHSNNCVLDLRTKLMWSRNASGSVGPTSNGKLPFTTNGNGEGLFAYISAANIAMLSGYSNWRTPNAEEAISIMDYEAPTAAPDSVAFPSWPISDYFNTASTRPGQIANAVLANYSSGNIGNSGDKTTPYFCALVRDINP